MAKFFSLQPGKSLRALALVCVGKLNFDTEFSARSTSTPVYLAQIYDDRRRIGPANDEKMEDEYE